MSPFRRIAGSNPDSCGVACLVLCFLTRGLPYDMLITEWGACHCFRTQFTDSEIIAFPYNHWSGVPARGD